MHEVKRRPEEEVQPRIRLGEYNRRFMRAVDDLSCCIEDDIGRCIAGLTGWRADDFAIIDLLWVDEEFRGQGLGGKLFSFAAEEARRLGAKRIEVNTFSFQSPGFYEKQGCREFARLDHCLSGYAHHFYVKEL